MEAILPMRSGGFCPTASRPGTRSTGGGTVYGWFSKLHDGAVFESLNHHRVQLDRPRLGREPGPSAAVIDSQSVKTTEAGGPRGYDAGKKVMGRKRRLAKDFEYSISSATAFLYAAATIVRDLEDEIG